MLPEIVFLKTILLLTTRDIWMANWLGMYTTSTHTVSTWCNDNEYGMYTTSTHTVSTWRSDNEYGSIHLTNTTL